MTRYPNLVISIAFILFAVSAHACTDDDSSSSTPIADCDVRDDATMVCPDSFPGCTFRPDLAAQFESCGRRYEYVVYGRADGCPELFYYPEGTFRSHDDWQAYVGACEASRAT
ncbi:MAG: hypothetical protein AB7R00_26705 [Kofleriaceae bacterium]